MTTKPYSSLHENSDDHLELTPEQMNDTIEEPSADHEALKAQISDELHQQLALERFQQERPELWIQVSRIGHLMDLQGECEHGEFPPGSCFIYANVPGYQNFAVKKVLGVDLDTCQTTIDIYGDNDLEEGTIMLPLEAISWYGFPKQAVPLTFRYLGFSIKRAPEKGQNPSTATGVTPKAP